MLNYYLGDMFYLNLYTFILLFSFDEIEVLETFSDYDIMQKLADTSK